MSLKDPVHLLFGYVDLRAENGFPERFINLCTAAGIPLWDIKKSGEKITAKTTVDGYRRIRSPAKQSSMKVRLIKRHGIPFIINKALSHTGLVLGFSVMLVILAFLSGRIWVIEVENQTDIPCDEIISAYEKAGLKIGTNKRTDIQTIRSEATDLLKNASWTTVNINGSVATIKVNGLNKIPQISQEQGTANIVAAKDGQVEIIEPYRGSSAVKPGQTVMQGELLVSGITEYRTQGNIYSDAEGYVVARTVINVKTETDKTLTELVPKSKKMYSIYFLGKEFPQYKNRKSQLCYYHKSRLYVGGREMPFGINYRIFTDFDKKTVRLSEKEQKVQAINNFALEYYHNTLHVQEIEKCAELRKGNEKISITGKCSCYENIGERHTFETEETTDTEIEKTE